MSLEMLSIGLDAVPHPTEMARSGLPSRYQDCRPNFLNLSSSSLKHSKDHEARPVIVLTEPDRLPWCSGYAETINGGKSAFVNEDHAAFDYERLEVFAPDARTGEEKLHHIELWYFGVFDGHAGCGASIFSAKNLHKHIISAMKSIGPLLLKEGDSVYVEEATGPLGPPSPPVLKDTLIQGALEHAFIDMDAQIKRERATYSIPGGCTAIAAVFVLGKLYISNAGDSRAIICREPTGPASSKPPAASSSSNSAVAAVATPSAGGLSLEVVEVSHDFTPETDRSRLQYLAMLQPKLLRGLFGRLQWQRRLRKRDLDKRVMCRDAHMQGWVYRTVTDEDLNYAPMLTGEGKRARLLGTIGTSRGFGDHDLVGPGDIHIKPFLTAAPEVVIYDLSRRHHTPDDVLVIATDGLWERLNNEEATAVVEQCLAKQARNASNRYNTVAQQLVLAARGNLTSKGWRTATDEQGSYDDISIFIIPLGRCPFNPPAPAPAETSALTTAAVATTTPTRSDGTTAGETSGGERQQTTMALSTSDSNTPGESTLTASAVASTDSVHRSLMGSSTDTVVGKFASPPSRKGSAAAAVSELSAALAGGEEDTPQQMLSPSLSLVEKPLSPNLSIDSDMVVLDSLSAANLPSAQPGRGEAATGVATV